jgi:hypothetical protein
MKFKVHSILTGIVTALVFLAGSITISAQTPALKTAFTFNFDQIQFDRNNPAEYLKGYDIDTAAKLTGDKTRLYLFANYKRKLDVLQVDPETYPLPGPVPTFDQVRRDTENLHIGLRFSHSFGPFEPFASAGVGTRFGNEFNPNRLSRLYQVGGDINITKYVFLRAGADFQRITGLEGTEQGFFVGGGFRFK